MTRTDVVASSRPRKADAAPNRKGFSAMRKLAVLPVAFALVMALVVPTTALAAEGLSGYNNKPPTPTTGTSPSKESSTPTKTTAPETSSAEPSTTSEPTATTAKKSSTLPFTGFDLRWTIGAGLVLLAMGFSIVTVQRRQRRSER